MFRRFVVALALCALVASPSWAAIGRTARGTATGAGTDGSGAFVAMNCTVGTSGSTLVICVMYNASLNGTMGSVFWNGTKLPGPVIGNGSALGFMQSVYVLPNAPAVASQIVFDDSNAGGVGEWFVDAVEVTGAATASYDVSAGTNGNGTAPTSGSATTTAANDMLIGFVSRAAAGISGTWTGGFTAGQNSVGNTHTLEDAYQLAATAGSYAVGKSDAGIDWIAQFVAIKQAASGGTTATAYQRSISGRHRVRRRTP